MSKKDENLISWENKFGAAEERNKKQNKQKSEAQILQNIKMNNNLDLKEFLGLKSREDEHFRTLYRGTFTVRPL